MRLQVPSVLPSVAAGGGAATLKASQSLVIGNAVASLQLSRNVPVSNLAKVARVAARALGPLALAGLVYEGLQWANGEWGYVDPSSAWFESVNNPSCGVLTATGMRSYNGAPGSYTYFYRATSHVHHGGSPPVPGAETYNYCQNPDSTWDALYKLAAQPDLPESEVSPATDQQMETAFQQGLTTSPAVAGEVLDAALVSSAAFAELAPDPLSITGPATVDGGTTTRTKVDTAGTTTTQIQTTYNLSYQGDTVNLTQMQVETVTDPANNVTTTTTTTDTPTGDPPPPDEPPDLCAENPDASGCAPFGTPEPPTPLPQEDRTVSVAPEMSAAGACPAPQAFSIAGQSFQLTYDGACEFAQGIRPVVLAVAWMGAFVFLFSIGRAQTS